MSSTLEIGDEDRERFDRDGFLIVEGLLGTDRLPELHAAFDDLFNGVFETGIRPDEVNWQTATGDPSLTRQICNGWKANRAIERVVLDRAYGRAIGALSGWSSVRVMIDNVLWKPPGARSLGFHQDSAYLDWFRPNDLVTLWIALDATTARGGTLELVTGSHRWHRDGRTGDFHGPEDYRQPMRETAAAEGLDESSLKASIVPVQVKAGGGSFHHGWTWHGSGPNDGSAPRRALVLHAMRGDVEYVPERFGSGIGPIYGRYRRLTDNLLDENHFPVLWSENGYRSPGLDQRD